MVLMYHNIAEEPGFNTVCKQRFIDQMEFLSEKKYNVVSFDTYIGLVKNSKLTGNTITLSFDDAYESFMDIVLPILEQFKFSAILFVPVGFVGKFNEWDQHISDKRIPVMTWDELRSISKRPFITIGSHGFSHRPLSALAKKDIAYEIEDSKKELELKLGEGIEYFSYPYGQHKHLNSYAIECLLANGYKAACSTNWGRLNLSKSLFKLNRIEIEPGDTIVDFEKKLSSRFHVKYFKQIAKNILARFR